MPGINFLLVFIGVLLGISALLLGGFFILRFFLSKKTVIPSAFQKVILLITVPKETEVNTKKKSDETQQSLQEQISQTESFFAIIGGLKADRSLRSYLWGRTDTITFEIVAHNGLISFYAAVPQFLQRYFEQQLQAQFPHAQIEEVTDYNIFNKKGGVAGAYLKFTKPYYFPIKTYKKMEADPINGLTNALSKLQEGEAAVIQYVVRSAKAPWHAKGARLAREMQKGKGIGAGQSVLGNMGGSIVKGAGEMFKAGWTGKEQQTGASTSQDPYTRLSPMVEETVKGLEEKSSKAGVDANIRIIVAAVDDIRAKAYMENIINAFSQYNIYQYGNGFRAYRPKRLGWLVHDFIYRNFSEKRKMIFNTEEMASLYHLPLATTETPNIRWLGARKAPPPADAPKQGLILGHNYYRGQDTVIKIKEEDRRRHMYIVGMTGTGKSTLMEELAKQDIRAGRGVGVIDPHGDLVANILTSIPKERADDVILFDPSDLERPIGLNMLEADTEDEKDFTVQEMIAIFYKLFPPEMIGPMFEHNMRNVMLTLMSDKESPGTIAEIPRMFSDQEFQESWVAKVKDPVVRAFWEKEMAKTSDFHKSEMLGYLISKVGRFVENSMMRNIIGQSRSGINFKDLMNQQKILLVNLSKGKIGEVNSSLLGLIIVSKLQMAAFSRAHLPEAKRHDFYLYIDEFQNYTTDSVATILSEARKYRLDLIMAHQYIGQLVDKGDTKIRDAVFGNVGTLIAYRIGVEDAEFLSKQFAPVFAEYDLINIQKYNAYVKLLIDNSATRAFNMAAYPPSPGDPDISAAVRELSRLKYGRQRSLVEADIMERTQLGEAAKDSMTEIAERTL
jgi:hypothetical protein